MKKTLVQKLGLLGVVIFLSYTAAVVFSPLAYPGYCWMAQAVSDLSAANAPSLGLWNRLSSLYSVCELLCVMTVCVGMQGRGTKMLRTGVYLFAAMEWISAVGYRMFPLSESGYAGAFQDQMHMVITAPQPHHALRRLTERVLDFARANGFEQVNLEVRSDHKRAIRLYEKYGSRKLCTFPAFFKLHGQYIDFDLMNLDWTAQGGAAPEKRTASTENEGEMTDDT